MSNHQAAYPDPTNDAFVQMDVLHANIHKGWVWHANILDIALADNDNLDVLVTVGAIPAHMRFIVAVSHAMQGTLYEGTKATGGVSPVVVNRNRFLASASPLTDITTAPTITNLGDSLGPFYLSGGTGPHAPGGVTSGFEEWLLLPSKKYLFRITNNLTNQAGTVYASLDWYERPPRTAGQL